MVAETSTSSGKEKAGIKEVDAFVGECKYTFDRFMKFISRCVDGRYGKRDKDGRRVLPPLAFPGGDYGQIAVLLAVSRNNNLEIDIDKAFNSLCKVVGGKENLRIHTAKGHDKFGPKSGCGHCKTIANNSKDFCITSEDVGHLDKMFEDVEPVVLEGEHQERGSLIIRGRGSLKKGIFPKNDGELSYFVFHKELVHERNKALAKQLIKDGAINIRDARRLTKLLNETTDAHLGITLKTLAKGKPVYEVSFDRFGRSSVKQLS